MEKTLSKLKQVPSNSSTVIQFDYNAFTAYLQGIAGGNRTFSTAKSIAADVNKFISQAPKTSSTTDSELLLNRKAIEAYFVSLKAKEYKPTTIAEK